MRPKYVVLVEDDHIQAESFKDALMDKYKKIRVDAIPTEHEFERRLDDFVKRPPDVFVIDVMVRGTDPSPDGEYVPQEQKGSFFRAGMRCENKLRQRKSKTPVILYTVLQKEDLAEDLPSNPRTRLVTKDADFSGLYAAIENF
jgi:DNA-binding NarL/FixJ family response regulator